MVMDVIRRFVYYWRSTRTIKFEDDHDFEFGGEILCEKSIFSLAGTLEDMSLKVFRDLFIEYENQKG